MAQELENHPRIVAANARRARQREAYEKRDALTGEEMAAAGQLAKLEQIERELEIAEEIGDDERAADVRKQLHESIILRS